MTTPLFESTLRSLTLLGRGKVRDIYAIDADKLLIVTSDRLSAFDVIDQTLEYQVKARVTPNQCQVFLGIDQPVISADNQGGGRIEFIQHGSPEFNQGNTSLYQLTPEAGVDELITVRCEFLNLSG